MAKLKPVYAFEEADSKNRMLLGGKGAGLSEMTRLKLPVPPGFTITTQVCNQYYDNGRKLEKNVISEVMRNISKIEKKEPKPVLKVGVTDQSADNLQKEMVSYYKIPVDYEIKGNFLGYIKFKRAVSKQKKMLNFDKETISVVQNDSTGAIVATGELTIVGMPDEFF